MQTSNVTLNRLGALVLVISSLLIFGSNLYVPEASQAPQFPWGGTWALLWQTGWLFIAGMTLFPFGVLTLYDHVAKQGGGRLALTALIFQLLAIGPLQAFAGLDTIGLATLREAYFTTPNETESSQAIQNVLAQLSQNGGILHSLPFPWSISGLYTLLIIGFVLLDIGMILFVIAVWRTGALSKWASILYALGFVLLIKAMYSFQGDPIHVITVVIGIAGTLWLAWNLWRPQIRRVVAEASPSLNVADS